MAVIEFKEISKFYGDNPALSDISFSIEKKEFVTLVGHSGSGKSTVFKLILGEELPSIGKVFRDRKNISEMKEDDLLRHRRRTGTIFQDFRLLGRKTVYENIAFAMETLGFDDSRIKSDVPYVLELVDLKHKMWSFPDEISGGEKQRTAIARAIINQPELLLADEPTGNLDPVNTYEVINILKQINKLGTTVILATHDKSVVQGIGGRVITLTNGALAMDAPNGKYIL